MSKANNHQQIPDSIRHRQREVQSAIVEHETAIRELKLEDKRLTKALTAIEPIGPSPAVSGSCTVDDVIAALKEVVVTAGVELSLSDAKHRTLAVLEDKNKSHGASLRWEQAVKSKKNPFVVRGERICVSGDSVGVDQSQHRNTKE